MSSSPPSPPSPPPPLPPLLLPPPSLAPSTYPTSAKVPKAAFGREGAGRSGAKPIEVTTGDGPFLFFFWVAALAVTVVVVMLLEFDSSMSRLVGGGRDPVSFTAAWLSKVALLVCSGLGSDDGVPSGRAVVAGTAGEGESPSNSGTGAGEERKPGKSSGGVIMMTRVYDRRVSQKTTR